MIDTSNFTDQQGTTFYRDHVQNWQDSGLNKSAYCRAHGLRTDNFRYWLRKFATQEALREMESAPSKRRLRLVPVQQRRDTPLGEQGCGIEIQFADCRVVLKGAVDEANLRTVLHTLRGATCGA